MSALESCAKSLRRDHTIWSITGAKTAQLEATSAIEAKRLPSGEKANILSGLASLYH